MQFNFSPFNDYTVDFDKTTQLIWYSPDGLADEKNNLHNVFGKDNYNTDFASRDISRKLNATNAKPKLVTSVNTL